MGVIEADDRVWKGVPMTGKQSTAEWLRGIVDGAHRNETYPTCAGIVRTFFGLECPDVRSCGSCILMMLTAIAGRIDAERAIPEGIEWPRFEDGELVKVGDTVGSDEPFTAEEIAFESDRWLVKASARSVCGCFHGAFGEPVKRPTLKVLDADGVPIEVGDTVWATYDGRKYVVKAVCSDGSLNPEMVTDDGCMVKYVEGGWDFAKKVTHERPDSWERLSNDAKMGAVTYADRILGVDTRETTTEEDYEAFARDIVRRAKALAKAGEVE